MTGCVLLILFLQHQSQASYRFDNIDTADALAEFVCPGGDGALYVEMIMKDDVDKRFGLKFSDGFSDFVYSVIVHEILSGDPRG